jgi:hypothetical protein
MLETEGTIDYVSGEDKNGCQDQNQECNKVSSLKGKINQLELIITNWIRGTKSSSQIKYNTKRKLKKCTGTDTTNKF